jgi:hypothetical protein
VLSRIKWTGHLVSIREMGDRAMKCLYRERMTAQNIRHWKQPITEKNKVIPVVNYVIKRLAVKTYVGVEV